MTPAARVAAAIDVLDRILAGQPAEQALTNWARANRYAGSGDRAAVRDHAFGAIRCRRSFAALGGAETGRGLMIGALMSEGIDPATVFTGEGYAPSPLSPAEGASTDWDALPDSVRLDYPDWLEPALRSALAEGFSTELETLRRRAPVFLRVNLAKTDRAGAEAALREDGIETAPHRLAKTALHVVANARRIRSARAYRDGLVELQDAASQAVPQSLGDVAGLRILDYCAGGGGKSLALAAAGAVVSAYDANPGRMSDLSNRVARAGVRVEQVTRKEAEKGAPWPLILVDAPCSGSGAWRRQVEAKWRLTPERLAELCAAQAAILDRTAPMVRQGGRLAYVTCSILNAENQDQIIGFLARHPGWRCAETRIFRPSEGGDGFFLAVLTHA
ncbi:MAG: RsmB/NOP family class I SAM-dependent RNA methyltransferase [Pseudomonadota bacterium]